MSYLETAVEAAEEAAKIQKEGLKRVEGVDYKGPRDIVTRVDVDCEEAIKERIRDDYPSHEVLGEETGRSESVGSDERWIVDPLDGTTNFVHGVPHFCVSIALEVSDELRVGVVYHTPTDDVYTAVRGEGARLNGEPLSVSSAGFDEALVSTGFTVENADEDDYFAALRRVITETHGVRRFGTAAYDLVTVAEGTVDCFYERHLNPWDVAAGTLIVEEAGGRVTDFEGNDGWEDVREGNVVASNAETHDSLLGLFGSDV